MRQGLQLETNLAGEIPAFGPSPARDLDWEWPGSEGNPGNIIRPEDKQNFTKLVAEFRSQLDGLDDGEHHLLTAFLPAADRTIEAGFEVRKLFQLFDYATFQGYDLAGAWDLSATNHHSKLFAPKGDPLPAVLGRPHRQIAPSGRGTEEQAGDGHPVVRPRLDRRDG